ncbi:organic cation transporter protein-like [Lingula anatina]|uniref:Organic cation transporter protein-like n=1 Tax=Lingula anatina TaxID=7574 RepID=A0A1S3K9N8_LINAN|nr:organic cation transporter protein-like [Lingula anatina]|eukprot:XP_013419159.1 organic cation transporter protein-like [Lingula anatina]
MNFDDLLKILGELGTYQRQRYALLCIVAVYSVTSTVGIVFYGIEPNHHCKIPSAYVDVVTSKYGNVSQEELLNLTIPYTDKGERSSCKLYTFDERYMYTATWFLANDSFYYGTALKNNTNTSWTAINYKGSNNQAGPPSSAPCPEGRVYSSGQYESTIVSEGLGGSLYLSFALLGAADIPGLLAAAFCIDKLGRRKTIFGTICLGGSLCIASGLIPTSMFYLTIACAALGKMLITLSKAVLGMFLVESYPTVIRHMGLSFCSSVARLGAVITPQILFLGRVYRPLPFIIWGAVAICTGFLILLVPETLNKPLLQTVEEWDVVLDRKILGCTSKKDGNVARDTTTTGESSYL